MRAAASAQAGTPLRLCCDASASKPPRQRPPDACSADPEDRRQVAKWLVARPPRLCSRPGRCAEADRPPDAPGPVTRPSRQVYRPRALADRPGVEVLHKLRGGVPACCAVRPPCSREGQPFSFHEFAVAGHGPPELVKLLRTHAKRHFTTPDGRIFQTARAGSSRTRPASRCGTRPASRLSPPLSGGRRLAAAPTACANRRNRSHRPVRGFFRPHPWTKPDAYGRIADGGSTGQSLERHMCWSAAWSSSRRSGL